MTKPNFGRPSKITKVSASFHDHKKRTPPSVNPGVDYAAPADTLVVAPANGHIVAVKRTTSGATGRYIVIDFGHGWVADIFHLSRVTVNAGDRVKKGERIGYSGGSGFGSEHGYAPHIHISIRSNGLALTGVGNRDFEELVDTDKPKVVVAES